MLIKQCHDLLSVTKHLLFQSQGLASWKMYHLVTVLLTSLLSGLENKRPEVLYGLCQGTYIYLFKQKL